VNTHDIKQQEATKIQFPDWASVLWREEVRYISLRGGRGSGKSMSTARALILRAADKPLRILCGRETQKSLEHSVYQQLIDEIKTLGLESEFSSTLSQIRHINGSVFLFAGFSDQTADGLKSFANVDIVWVEEAASISEKTWKALIPTIRKETSQFILCWNPNLTDDPTWLRFVVNKPKNCLDIVINYDQNPWFPKVLDDERIHDLGTLPENQYRNTWLGEPLSSLDGAVYEREIGSLYNEKRIVPLTVDNNLSLHAVMDLGMNDDTSIIIVQATPDAVRIVDFIEGNRTKLSEYSDALKQRGYGRAKIWLPHDARQQNLQTGLTAQELMASYGWTVEITPSMSVEDGIRAVRELFPKMYFDSGEGCKKLIEHVRRYHRNRLGNLVHDIDSHASDAIRYVAINAPAMRIHSKKSNMHAPLNYRANLVLS
jgi:phage terminase large subunit